jgi:hypothetical protein
MSKETENTELSTDKALHIGGVSGSFYGNFNAAKITVRRLSDNALLIVDMMNDEHWKKRLEQFCKGTDGYLSNYRCWY